MKAEVEIHLHTVKQQHIIESQKEDDAAITKPKNLFNYERLL